MVEFQCAGTEKGNMKVGERLFPKKKKTSGVENT
jgi:hypothetical protein